MREKERGGGLVEWMKIFQKFWTENRGHSQTPPFMAVGRWVK